MVPHLLRLHLLSVGVASPGRAHAGGFLYRFLLLFAVVGDYFGCSKFMRMEMDMTNEVDVSRATSAALQTVSWIVLLVGLIAAGVAVYFGFHATEPYAVFGSAVTEGWQSVALGLLAGAVVLAAALTAWGVLQAHRYHVLYGHHHPGVVGYDR
jgi:uncharacterized membrane protein